MSRGYDRPLYIMPFDHCGSFQRGLFGCASCYREFVDLVEES